VKLHKSLGMTAGNASALRFCTALSIFINISSLTYGDQLYVVNVGNNTVERFDSAGTPSLFFSAPNYLSGGLALDNSGNLYVDTVAGEVWRIDSGGHGSFFGTGLNQPRGMACDRNGLLYVANSADNTIVRYDTSGQRSVFGSVSVLHTPASLAFDQSGSLYVANYYSHGFISRFDPQLRGSYWSFQVNACYGLAIDSHDTVYVGSGNATQGTWSVYKFDSQGGASVFATFSSIPTGLAFDSSDNLYVALGNNTIQKVDPQGAVSLFANTGLSAPYFMVVQVPEPSTLALVVLGAAALVIARRRR
jgi:sugar lactone lactonase YvrE